MGLFSRPAKTHSSRKLSTTLRERGYVYQHSTDTLEEITDTGVRMVYLGIDPSADSLHVGNLQAILMLRRFLEAGHKVILVIGGGTGMIGDPSGKNEERVLLDEHLVHINARAIGAQVKHLFSGMPFRMVNNADWLSPLHLLEFLRDVGKYFSVNAMLQRDSVRDRLENREQGISYTEFSYMLLQAYDFLHLHEAYGCDLQIASSDQWGNIVSGIDLIRRKTGNTTYGLTAPLLINKSTGKKFGKSESGAVWLDPAKTTPFDFYQFWINAGDADVEEYLLKMTLLQKEEIDTVMSEQNANPASRVAQKRLAWEVTALVHGKNEADKAKEASEKIFGGGRALDLASVPTVPVGKLRDSITDFSTSELRRLVGQGAISRIPSGEKIESIDAELQRGDVVRIGKNKIYRAQ